MINNFSCFFRYFTLFILAFTHYVGAEPANASSPPSVRLLDHVPTQAVANALFVQNLDSTVHIPLTFIMPLRNKEALEELVQKIYDPQDKEHYRKYLTSEEFIERFAPTQEDYDKVIHYAQSLGLSVTKTHKNRLLLNVKGITSNIENAFKLSLHEYRTANGRLFHAPNNNPEVPAEIASIIHGIVGLDNHAVWRAFNRLKLTADELVKDAKSNIFPSGPGGGYAPGDIKTAYDLNGLSVDGSGQSIALFELGGYLASDINEYTQHFGLPSPKLKNILVDGGSTSGIDAEVTLDIELAIALAPESEIYVYEGPNSNQGVLNTYNQIATDNLAKQVSTSWGLSENLVNTQYLKGENAIFLQMAAHGQTIYAAAGDSGAYGDSSSQTLEVNDPASQPYVVGVGGTKLTVNPENGAYADETVWNEGPDNGAGGGGVSTAWPIPSWQQDISTCYSKTNRNVPDVSLNADASTGYAIYYNGQWQIYGGTSCAAPLWAAFTALVNQELLNNQKPVLGFANPILYQIANGPSHATDFHDIISGNNLYYSANPGYDNASGWGSFNGLNLFASLTNNSSVQPTQPILSPLLDITMTPVASFFKWGIKTYTIQVSNNGNAATSGPVTVNITFPKGVTLKSIIGTGWTFNDKTLTCIQNSVLEPGSSYPTIELKVYVRLFAANSGIPIVTVSGGGSTSGN